MSPKYSVSISSNCQWLTGTDKQMYDLEFGVFWNMLLHILSIVCVYRRCLNVVVHNVQFLSMTNPVPVHHLFRPEIHPFFYSHNVLGGLAFLSSQLTYAMSGSSFVTYKSHLRHLFHFFSTASLSSVEDE